MKILSLQNIGRIRLLYDLDIYVSQMEYDMFNSLF